ncbi:thiamine biosynthesis protein ThiS [Gluconobacter thailandicus NBRC 3257]|uniref:Thiamine biosynthesis protein ThiS n=2 Tax=Gluconobacter thailandicus TaxID=257438 RepID=A0ABQ0IS52_GLUTH|nr:thiamine biosynthesis protein ThiS [Gluconobacter thailandicus NBRC 3257]
MTSFSEQIGPEPFLPHTALDGRDIMQITVNDELKEVHARTLGAILDELGYGKTRVATALNGFFVPATQRSLKTVDEGAVLEILAPMQGG